jgi:hypothetical protein
MQARPRTLRFSTAAVGLSLSAIAPAGCGSDCADYGQASEPVCDNLMGSANVTAPAVYALPATVPLVDGHTCLDVGGRCTDYPVVHLMNTVGRGQFGIEITLRLPAVEGSATYTYPSAWTVNYFNLNAELNAMSDTGTPSGQNLEWVGGTINVEASSAAELRLTFDLELQSPSAEVFSITAAAVTVNGCHVKTTMFCVPAGDD